jgi:hypothetical protein
MMTGFEAQRHMAREQEVETFLGSRGLITRVKGTLAYVVVSGIGRWYNVESLRSVVQK